MDDGIDEIEDAEELAVVRRQARRVHLRAAVFALLLTGAALALG